MTKTIAVVWKEYRELRWFLLAGLILFLGFPLLVAVKSYYQHQEFIFNGVTEVLVVGFGGFFSILVAVGAACSDAKDKLHDFWMSRPIGLTRFVLTKYFVGLTVVVLVCVTPLIVQLMIGDPKYTHIKNSNTFTFAVLICHSFTLVLIYSTSFFIGTVVRQAAPAAILSLSVGLLIYFLPVLMPPLESLSLFNIIDRFEIKNVRYINSYIGRDLDQYYPLSRQWYIPLECLHFVGMMLMASATAAVFSWLALRGNWRVRMNRQVIFWSLGVVVVLLFASCAFQLGSNLTAEKIVPLGTEEGAEGRSVARIASEQNRGALLLYNYRPNWISSESNYSLRAFDLSVANTRAVKEVFTHTGRWPGYLSPNANQLIWSAQSPNRAYLLPNEKLSEPTGSMKRKNDELWTIALDAPCENAIIHKLDLKKHLPDLRSNSTPSLYLFRDTIYVYGGKLLLLIDISDPDIPKVAQSIPVERCGFGVDNEGPNGAQVRIKHLSVPAIPSLTDQERFRVFFYLAPHNWSMAYDGDLLVVATREHLSTYRIEDMEAESVSFTLIGRRSVNPLKRLAGFFPKQMIIQNGLAYVLDTENSFGGLTVFDIRNPKRPRRIGHYATPEERFLAMAVLPNNRILVGGSNLHIVAPPRLQVK